VSKPTHALPSEKKVNPRTPSMPPKPSEKNATAEGHGLGGMGSEDIRKWPDNPGKTRPGSTTIALDNRRKEETR